jgi:hypothetical protein
LAQGHPEDVVKYRIAMWATAGLFVAVWWAILAVIIEPAVTTSNPLIWTLARLTCPLLFASFHFHFSVGLFSVLASNVVVYTLVGIAVENLRRQITHAR